MDTRLHALYKHSYSIQFFRMKKKPDDGQCWPKHVVFYHLLINVNRWRDLNIDTWPHALYKHSYSIQFFRMKKKTWWWPMLAETC